MRGGRSWFHGYGLSPMSRFAVILGFLSAVAFAGAVRADDARDTLLMLDSRPLHLRFRITLDGEPLESQREAYLKRLMVALDLDHDGKITQKESMSSPLFNARKRLDNNPFLASLDEKRILTPRDIKLNVDRIGGETVSYRQDDSAADTDLQVFSTIDTNSSGQIERDEMRLAAALVAAKDRDRDHCILFEEFLPPPETPADPFAVAAAPQQDDGPPPPSISTVLRDMREPLLPVRVVKRYDRNRDGKLTQKEIGWPAERFQRFDADKDGYVNSRELKALAEGPVDLEIAVEISGEAGKSAVTLVSSTADAEIPSERPDLIRLKFGDVSMAFSFRNIDPMKSAIDNALRTFNDIDLDANGYIDRTEIGDRYRFERYLFDAIDADGDGKMFADEMEAYIRVRGEPATSTCQVNVHNIGNGFFQLLDASGDGRISIRELRGIESRLLSAAAPGHDALAPRDTGSNYHIEFVRGSYQLFGRSDRMAVQGPTFVERPSVGPIWFQRMDRNQDSDLTWDEFLGPREAFHALDTDRDGLIDFKEAERGEEI